VDVAYDQAFAKAVARDELKAEAALKDMDLWHYGRLSVTPVKDAEWKVICRMGGIGP
jgi:predicted RNA-binding protein with PUA-like domain